MLKVYHCFRCRPNFPEPPLPVTKAEAFAEQHREALSKKKQAARLLFHYAIWAGIPGRYILVLFGIANPFLQIIGSVSKLAGVLCFLAIVLIDD